jgi:predicted thioesterase
LLGISGQNNTPLIISFSELTCMFKAQKTEIQGLARLVRHVEFRHLIGKPEGKRLLGRPGNKCKGNIKINL